MDSKAAQHNPWESEAQREREYFATSLRGYWDLYIGPKIAPPSEATVEILASKAQALTESENHKAQNTHTDMILVAQTFTLEVMDELQNGAFEGLTSTEIEARLQQKAAAFELDYCNQPPTIRSVRAALDINADPVPETRAANILSAAIAQKIFEHPYFQALAEREREHLLSQLDSNVTGPLLSTFSQPPSVEELRAVAEKFVAAVIPEIDREVVEYNTADKDDGDPEEYEPIDIIRNHMLDDHDFCGLIAQELRDEILARQQV